MRTPPPQVPIRKSPNNLGKAIETDQQIPLAESISLYFHDYEDTNWNHESYEKLAEMRTAEEYWTVFNELKHKLCMGMFFFMKENTFPRWDETEDSDLKYMFVSAKVLKQKIEGFVEHAMMKLISGSLLNKSADGAAIRGLSISPKKHFCIVKIWIAIDSETPAQTMRTLRNEKSYDLEKIYHGSLIFK